MKKCGVVKEIEVDLSNEPYSAFETVLVEKKNQFSKSSKLSSVL